MTHLTSAEIFTALGLRALWKAPDWALKVISVAVIIKRSHLSGGGGSRLGDRVGP
jgi:hypothetical protein